MVITTEKKTTPKFLQSRFYWPFMFKDTYDHAQRYGSCQMTEGLSKQIEIPLQNIFEA